MKEKKIVNHRLEGVSYEIFQLSQVRLVPGTYGGT